MADGRSRFERGPDKLREVDAGDPNVSGLVLACEDVISPWVADGGPGPAGEAP